jgi:hypothetical protein
MRWHSNKVTDCPHFHRHNDIEHLIFSIYGYCTLTCLRDLFSIYYRGKSRGRERFLRAICAKQIQKTSGLLQLAALPAGWQRTAFPPKIRVDSAMTIRYRPSFPLRSPARFLCGPWCLFNVQTCPPANVFYGERYTSTLERCSTPVMRVPLSLTSTRTQVPLATW